MINTIGLMSGTSMDGIDASYIESNGYEIINNNIAHFLPYDEAFKKKLSHIISSKASDLEIKKVESEITELHFIAIEQLLKKYNLQKTDIDEAPLIHLTTKVEALEFQNLVDMNMLFLFILFNNNLMLKPSMVLFEQKQH